MLNYLANTTHLDIIMAVYQCTRFSKNPKLSHEKAIKRIIKYLIRTKCIEIEAKINLILELIAYGDLDFANS